MHKACAQAVERAGTNCVQVSDFVHTNHSLSKILNKSSIFVNSFSTAYRAACTQAFSLVFNLLNQHFCPLSPALIAITKLNI